MPTDFRPEGTQGVLPARITSLISSISPIHVSLFFVVVGFVLPWANSVQGRVDSSVNGFTFFRMTDVGTYSNLPGFLAYLIFFSAGLVLILNLADIRFMLKANHVLVTSFALTASTSCYIAVSSKMPAGTSVGPGAVIVSMATVVLVITAIAKLSWRDFGLALFAKLAILPTILVVILWRFSFDFLVLLVPKTNKIGGFITYMEPALARAIGPLTVGLWLLLLLFFGVYLRGTFAFRTILANSTVVLSLLLIGFAYYLQIMFPELARTYMRNTDMFRMLPFMIMAWRGLIITTATFLLPYLLVMIALNIKSVAAVQGRP